MRLASFVLAFLAGLPACTLSSSVGDSLRLQAAGPSTEVHDGERLLLAYRSDAGAFKPYVVQLFTPEGRQILRDAPADHDHHHALMLALGVDELDFWGERHAPKPGWQRGDPVAAQVQGTGATLRHAIAWTGPDGTELLHEEREILVPPPGDGPTRLTWRSVLTLPAGKATARLWGRHYFGLGMRFLQAMDGAGRFLTAGNEPSRVVRGDERLTRSRWCAYSAPLGDREVTVAMFDHPHNPRSPATWFTMATPFTYLAATLELEKPLPLSAGERLSLRYGVALWDGSVPREQIEEQYRRWLEKTP